MTTGLPSPATPIQVRTVDAPAPRGTYSQAIRVGSWVITSGIGPRHPQTGQLEGDTVATQTDRVLHNMQAILEAAGASMRDVVQTRVYLGELQRDFAAFDEVYSYWWGDVPPARTTVGATLNGILVEIDAVAVVGSG